MGCQPLNSRVGMAYLSQGNRVVKYEYRSGPDIGYGDGVGGVLIEADDGVTLPMKGNAVTGREW